MYGIHLDAVKKNKICDGGIKVQSDMPLRRYHVSPRLDPTLPTQVKREEIEESVSAQAQLLGAATSLSEDILRYQSQLADFKEALECCICLERTVREREGWREGGRGWGEDASRKRSGELP